MHTLWNEVDEDYELIATDEEIKQAVKQELYLIGEIVGEVVIEVGGFDYTFKVTDYLTQSELKNIDTEILIEAGLIEAETEVKEVA